MRVRYVLVALATLSLGFADTLTLRSGRTVQGSYLGGTARQIRMAVGERVESFDVSDVASLQFESAAQPSEAAPQAAAPITQSAPAVAQSAPAVAQAAQPAATGDSSADQRRILRRESAPPPASTTPVAASPSSPANASEIPSGTDVTIRMIDEVDSQVNSVGQTFRASVDEPVMVGDRTLIPRGADVITKLVESKDPSKLAGGGELTLALDSITVNGKTVEVTSQGVTTAGQSRKKETGAVVGGGAALGAIIGAIAGGGKGAAIGAISGAGAGTAVQVLTKGTRVRIPSETRLTFTLQNPVRL